MREGKRAPRSASVPRATLPAAALAGALVVGQAVCWLATRQFVPAAVLALAVVFGCLNAMFAVGLVLIYRAGRIINFAHAGPGAVATVLFILLVGVWGWSWYLAMPAALAASALLGLVIELTVVRRLANAPRLALTVVTVAVGQLLVAGSGLMPLLFLDPGEDLPQAAIASPVTRFTFDWFPVTFKGDHLLVVAVAVLAMAALASFFRMSRIGIAVRGAAENGDRAALLGINVNNLSTVVWVVAAALAGLAALLRAPLEGGTVGGLVGLGTFSAGILLRALAAAVIGRMESLPVTVAAAVAISIFEQSVLWAFSESAIADVALLVVIVGLLLARRQQVGRTDAAVTGTWEANVEVRPVPAELAVLPGVRTRMRQGYVAMAVVALAYPWVMSPSQTNLGGLYVIYGIVAISLVVLTGWGGQISLGQFAFVAVGAVVGGALTSRLGWPFPIAVVAASLAGGAAAVVLGLPALRIQGLFLAVTTLAFSLATATFFLNERYFGWMLPGNAITRPRLLWVDTEDERAYFYLCLAGLLFALLVAKGLRGSRAGRVLIAMRDNERTAQSLGVNLIRTRLVTFAISGCLASFAGALLAHHQHSVAASEFGPEQSIQIFLVAVIGGLGSVTGVLTGALYFGTVTIFVDNTFGQLLASGAGVLAILLFYPGGLGALLFSLRDTWLRRVATRNRIFVPSLVGDYRVLDGSLALATLAPNLDPDGRKVPVPVRYRVDSVIEVRGRSQRKRAWRY